MTNVTRCPGVVTQWPLFLLDTKYYRWIVRCISQSKEQPRMKHNKYQRLIKGQWVDVYDILMAFDVTNPALQHLIKKALMPGTRGHKTREEDLREILASAKRAIKLEGYTYG